MGQRYVKPEEHEPVGNPPTLHHNNSTALKECKICLEKKRKGIVCAQSAKSFDHFVCRACFSPYVSSIISNPGKFSDDLFVVKCPIPECTSHPWSSHDIRLVLDGDTLDRYIDALVEALGNNGINSGRGGPAHLTSANEDVSKHVHDIANALNMRCPKCRITLDPSPDGCAAMRCLCCGTYFCFMCLRICDSNLLCHAHVRKCVSNPKGNLFPKEAIRNAAHRSLRIRAVKHQLETEFGLNWTSDASARKAIKLAVPLLKQSDLTEKDIYAAVDVTGGSVGGGVGGRAAGDRGVWGILGMAGTAACNSWCFFTGIFFAVGFIHIMKSVTGGLTPNNFEMNISIIENTIAHYDAPENATHNITFNMTENIFDNFTDIGNADDIGFLHRVLTNFSIYGVCIYFLKSVFVGSITYILRSSRDEAIGVAAFWYIYLRLTYWSLSMMLYVMSKIVMPLLVIGVIIILAKGPNAQF